MRLSDAFKCVGRAVSYHPKLAKPLGGANAVLFFEQIFFWMDKTDNPLGVFKTAAELEEETGLTVQEQRTARAKLRERGILIETEKRIEHKIYYRIDLDKFNELLEAQHWGNAESTFAESTSNIPEMQNQHSGNAESTFAESGINSRIRNKRLLQENTAREYTPLPPNSADENCANALVAANATTADADFENLADQNAKKPEGSLKKQTEKRFIALANLFNQVFAGSNVQTVSLEATKTNASRKRLIPAAWDFAKRRVLTWCDADGLIDGEKPSSKHVLQWFEAYFAQCLTDPFINGTSPRSKGHENWKPDFSYLLKATTLEKRILESQP